MQKNYLSLIVLALLMFSNLVTFGKPQNRVIPPKSIRHKVDKDELLRKKAEELAH